MNISKDVKVSVVLGHVAAGTAAKTTSVIDMQGFGGVMFVAVLGAVTAGSQVTLQAQEDIVNPMANAKNLSGAVANSTAGVADSNRALLVDIYMPKERYLQAVVTPSTQSAEIASVIAIQYQPGAKPTKIDASVIASVLAVSPDEI